MKRRLSEERADRLQKSFDHILTILAIYCPCGYGPGGTGRNAWAEPAVDETCNAIIEAEEALIGARDRVLDNLRLTP